MSDQTIYINPDGTAAHVNPAAFIPGGPADPKAPAVQKIYTTISGVLGIVAILGTFGLINADQAASLAAVGTTGATFLGAAVAAAASFRTKNQIDNGTLTTEAPVLPVVPALDQMKILRDLANQEIIRSEDRAKGAVETIQDAVSRLPGGTLINAAVNAAIPDEIEDLLRSVGR